MWHYYNPNPSGINAIDCTVRALSLVLDKSWTDAYWELALAGAELNNMPSANEVWGHALRDHGFRREAIPDRCPDCYTAEDFCRDHPVGMYVLAFDSHVAAVVDGVLYDSWDSSTRVPCFYWYKEATR